MLEQCFLCSVLAVPLLAAEGGVAASPLPCELNTAITCRDDIAPPPILPRRHSHPPSGHIHKSGNQRDGRQRRRRCTTSTRSAESAAAAPQLTKFQTPLLGGTKGTRWVLVGFSIFVQCPRWTSLKCLLSNLLVQTLPSESCHMTFMLPPVGVEVCNAALLSHHRRRWTNIATSMETTAVTMATLVSMVMDGRAGLGMRRTFGFVSWKPIGSETRRCLMWAVAPVI